MQLVSYTGHCVSPKLVEKPLWRSSAMQRGEGSPLQFPKHFEQHVGDIAELELNENPLGEEKFHQLKCLQPGHPWRSSEFHVGSTSSRSFLLWFCFIYFVNRWSWSSRERFPLWRVPVQKPTKNHEQPTVFNKDQWKINKNPWKINKTQWKTHKINEKSMDVLEQSIKINETINKNQWKNQ